MTGLGLGMGLGFGSSKAQAISVTNGGPELLLQAEIVYQGIRTGEGDIIKAVAIPWLEIVDHIQRDAEFLKYFSQNPRKFEEFIAATYDRAGWDEVTLTPAKGDGGRDVIAVKNGWGSVRFLEQVKAYSPGHLVTHNDVRALTGTLMMDHNASKGLVTTTSDFAPGVMKDGEFAPLMPHRLELKNGEALVRWLNDVRQAGT